MHTSKQFRLTLRWFFTVAGAFVVALVAWEFVLGQLILQKPTSQTHPILGRIYGQGLYVQGKEGYGRTVLNELGLRTASLENDPIRAVEHNVLVLGDSYTQAMQVSDEAAFPQHLNDLLGQSVRVINAGREGASPADYVALADYNKKTFNPDVVVIQLNEADFTRDLLSDKQTFYYEKIAQGYALQENKSMVSSNELASRFANLQGILNFSVMRVALERVTAMRDNKPHGTSEFAQPTTQQVTMQQGDGSLERFVVQELKKVYRQPILLYIPEIDYFSPDYAKPHATEQHLADAAKDAGVTFISLLPDYVALYRKEHKTAHGFTNTQPGTGHINPLGHEVAAERLAEVLTPQTADLPVPSGLSTSTQGILTSRINQ